MIVGSLVRSHFLEVFLPPLLVGFDLRFIAVLLPNFLGVGIIARSAPVVEGDRTVFFCCFSVYQEIVL